jgi:hypothetical protein
LLGHYIFFVLDILVCCIHLICFKLIHVESSGGSGLAVEGPPPDRTGRGANVFDNLVDRASNQNGAESNDSEVNTKAQITLYRNGFVVNDGPLRDPNLEENKAFLASLNRGEVPAGTLRFHCSFFFGCCKFETCIHYRLYHSFIIA